MHVTFRYSAAAALALALTACSTNGSAIAPVPAAPAGNQPSGPTQAMSQFDMLEAGPSGAMERIHIFPIRGSAAFAAVRAAANNLTYHGGPIQKVPKIFLIYWQFSGRDPSAEQPYLTSYMNGVGGSSWLNTVTQYSSTSQGNITNPTGQVAGVWNDNTNTLPKRMSSSSIASEALRAVTHFGYSADAAYIVATPHGHNTSGFGTQFCAWHSATSSTHGAVAYTNLPYITDAGFSCGENSVNSGSAGLRDGVSIVSGHELAETQTDPQPPSGWVDSSGAEIGDKCAWMNLADIKFSTGTFPVQPLWDNKIGGCALSGP